MSRMTHGELAHQDKTAIKNTSVLPDPKCSLVNDFDDVPPPDRAWKSSKLGQYAAEQNEQMKLTNRRLAIHAYRLGQALILAKAKTKHGKWGGFLRKYRISHATWIRAKQLAERAAEADLRKLGLTEAYVKFGILVQRDVSDDHHQTVKKPAKRAVRAPKQKAVARKSGSPTKVAAVAESASDADAKGQEKKVAPVKEDRGSPLAVLVMIRNRLQILLKEMNAADLEKESVDELHSLLNEIVELAGQIGKEVAHE